MTVGRLKGKRATRPPLETPHDLPPEVNEFLRLIADILRRSSLRQQNSRAPNADQGEGQTHDDEVG